MLRVCNLNLAKKGSATDKPEINVPTHAFFFFLVPTTMSKH